jgi:hypothetical protein
MEAARVAEVARAVGSVEGWVAEVARAVGSVEGWVAEVACTRAQQSAG